MRNLVRLGSTPYGEPAAQVEQENYSTAALKECRAFLAQLRRQFGPEPVGASLQINAFPHAFGHYYEVVTVYRDDFQPAIDYAHKIEANTPKNWDHDAKEELGLIRPCPQL